MKNSIQKFGKFLSSMVMPNIGALIAFGFLAALFIDTGWLPNKQLSTLVGPMLTYLIPVLIASTGGYLVAGERGRVIGAIAVVGAILSDLNITMLMGAMIMGPLAGLVIKTFDRFMEDRMPAGFEMLINNFSIGILGMLLAIFGYWAVGPVMAAILAVLSVGVDTLVQHNLLPLIAVFIEPAKVLFLNNAINHGIFTPLATAQVLEHGKSILYMLEANPGPGLGVLLAYMFFCKDKTTKDSAPSAVIIHLFGGIHEIYFPYVLMNPMVIIAPMAKKAEVVILGNRYKLTTDRDEEGWLEKLAENFNGRVDKIAGGSRRFNPLNASILIGLQLEEEMYNLKQEARQAYERIKQQHEDIVKQQKAQSEKLLAEQKAEYEAKLLKERKSYEARMSAQSSQYSSSMQELRDRHAQEITRQQQEHAADMANLKSSQEAALTELQASKERQVTALKNELNSKSSQQADALKELQAKYDKLQKDYDELMELLEDA